jgi:uncharacterized membrane protein YqjE
MATTSRVDERHRTNGVSQELRDRSVGELVHLLTEQISTLARDEVELAKAELTRKGKAASVGGGMFGAAGIVTLLALGALTAAAILGLATLIDQAWIAAAVVGAAFLVVAGVLALAGRKSIRKASPLVPEQASESVKEDVEWIRTRAQSART